MIIDDFNTCYDLLNSNLHIICISYDSKLSVMNASHVVESCILITILNSYNQLNIVYIILSKQTFIRQTLRRRRAPAKLAEVPGHRLLSAILVWIEVGDNLRCWFVCMHLIQNHSVVSICDDF